MSANLLDKTGIQKVTFYVAPGPVETCDRCSAGIRNVAHVTYKDSTSSKYGSECINKILATAPDLRKLFNRDAKLLQRYNDAIAILSRPAEEMPRGSEYFGSGLFFVADSTGKDICHRTGRFFHPLFDEEKNGSGTRYVQADSAAYYSKNLREIEIGKAWFVTEAARIERFLARVLSKVTREQANQLTDVEVTL